MNDARMQRIIVVVTMSYASNARRRGRRKPTRERKRRAIDPFRRRDDERCNRRGWMAQEAHAEIQPRMARECNDKCRREDEQRERRATAREAQADTRARETRDRSTPPSRRRAKQPKRADGARGTRQDATTNGARVQRKIAVLMTNNEGDARRRGRREPTREREGRASSPPRCRNGE